MNDRRFALTVNDELDVELLEEEEILDEKEYEQTTIWQAARDGNDKVLQNILEKKYSSKDRMILKNVYKIVNIIFKVLKIWFKVDVWIP